MGKREEKQRRYRAQMIEAARSVIAETGLAQLNVRQISEKSGVSFGNLHHLFGGKEGLLLEVLKQLLMEIRQISRQHATTNDDPLIGLDLYVCAQFNPQIYTNENCILWLNFWNEAATQPAFARLETINRRRMQSNLRFYLKQVTDADTATVVASDIQSMIDGLWIRKAHLKGGQSAEAALDTIRRFILAQTLR